MCTSRNDRDNSHLKVISYSFGKVTSFKYIGVNINNKNNPIKYKKK